MTELTSNQINQDLSSQFSEFSELSGVKSDVCSAGGLLELLASSPPQTVWVKASCVARGGTLVLDPIFAIFVYTFDSCVSGWCGVDTICGFDASAGMLCEWSQKLSQLLGAVPPRP